MGNGCIHILLYTWMFDSPFKSITVKIENTEIIPQVPFPFYLFLSIDSNELLNIFSLVWLLLCVKKPWNGTCGMTLHNIGSYLYINEVSRFHKYFCLIAISDYHIFNIPGCILLDYFVFPRLIMAIWIFLFTKA